MTRFLDTSVVLRLLTGQPAAQAEAARRALSDSSAPAVVGDVVIAESYHALRHHYRVPHAEAVEALRMLVTSHMVQTQGHAAAVLNAMALAAAQTGASERASASPGLVDRLILAECVAHAGELLTFDRDLSRLSDARLP